MSRAIHLGLWRIYLVLRPIGELAQVWFDPAWRRIFFVLIEAQKILEVHTWGYQAGSQPTLDIDDQPLSRTTLSFLPFYMCCMDQQNNQ